MRNVPRGQTDPMVLGTPSFHGSSEGDGEIKQTLSDVDLNEAEPPHSSWCKGLRKPGYVLLSGGHAALKRKAIPVTLGLLELGYGPPLGGESQSSAKLQFRVVCRVP